MRQLQLIETIAACMIIKTMIWSLKPWQQIPSFTHHFADFLAVKIENLHLRLSCAWLCFLFTEMERSERQRSVLQFL